jgi:hypothetical protein
VLTDLLLGSHEPVHETVAGWLRGAERGLLALDAPLGWPRPLSDHLPTHRAGERLVGDPSRLFGRFTDRHVRATIGRRPLEVGADLIARTAHSALELLDRVRAHTGKRIPLAWTPEFGDDVCAIEVYPAATLRAHDVPCAGYKDERRETCRPTREAILSALASRIDVGGHGEALVGAADLLDAAVCILASLDFLAGRCMAPTGSERVARKEGWIWVQQPGPIAIDDAWREESAVGARLRELVFDCERPAALARFWTAVLDGYGVRAYDDAEVARLAAIGRTPETDPTVMVDGPGPVLCFQETPRRVPGERRLHVDVAAADRRREVRRLQGLGASVEREAEGYTVMRDPEGNAFCVVDDR